MCGILITQTGTEDNLNSIAHRGIEKSVIQKNGWHLCHHRLPIQTQDGDAWKQPLEISKGIYLLFNGEIFNYDRQRFSSDSEYLYQLFSRYQGGSFEMFCSIFLPEIQTWDGFWAIVIFDSNEDSVIAFTDPLGKKPLYYNNLGEICSEVKGLVSSNSEMDQVTMSQVRKWGYNTNNRTSYQEIKRFLPNTIYHYRLDSPEFKTEFCEYYKGFDCPISELTGASYEDHMEWLWTKMFESVSNRLISSNFPVSLLISGGLDSSIIGSILDQIGADVKWFSIENGEREYVDLLASRFSKEVTFLEYSMSEDINSEIYKKWNESPIDLGSVIPQYYLFDAVKRFGGYRIVLSGDGSDELFGGYGRIHEYDSQKSDILDELSYYHLPRLDKLSMAHTLELRNPFLNLDIVRFALHLPLEWRKDKKILKDTFGVLLPEEIVYRKKEALKNPSIKMDKMTYRLKAVNSFVS